MDEKSLQIVLSHLPITQIHYHPSIGSTNDTALVMLEQDALDGTLVVCDLQTAGRGRLNRRWITQPGSALAFSLILHPTEYEMSMLPLFAPLAGLAVCRALEQLNLKPEIKWPNDVLLERRKICGILVESSWSGSKLKGVVVGIGVNVAPSSVPPDHEVLFPAGCVEHSLGKPVERTDLLASILDHFFSERKGLGSLPFFKAWEQRLAFRGEHVRVEPPGKPDVTGVLVGLDEAGQLVLRSAADEIILISAGDVARLRPMV